LRNPMKLNAESLALQGLQKVCSDRI